MMNKYILCSFILILIYVNTLNAQNEKVNYLKFSELYEKQNGLFYVIKTDELFNDLA